MMTREWDIGITQAPRVYNNLPLLAQGETSRINESNYLLVVLIGFFEIIFRNNGWHQKVPGE